MLTLLLWLACASPDPSSPPAALLDEDGDGFATDQDCDDADPAVNPVAPERCGEPAVDEDCDGRFDEPGAVGELHGYVDADGDGAAGTRRYDGCPGRVVEVHAEATDCDDSDPSVHPGAVEVCDEVDRDENCDGVTDWGRDADGDGWGVREYGCEDAVTQRLGDCDDADPATHPEAREVCDNGVDDDCDGSGWPCGWNGTTPTSAATGGVGGVPLGAGDVDGDGGLDLVVAFEGNFETSGRLAFYPGPLRAGDSAVVLFETAAAGSVGTSAMVADLGAGRATVGFTAREADDRTAVVLLDGAGPVYISGALGVASAGDIDGDGAPDLLLRDGGGGVLAAPPSASVDAGAIAAVRISGTWNLMALGDVDGVGLGDAAGPTAGCQVALLLSPWPAVADGADAAGCFVAPRGGAGGVVGLDDLDGDGLREIGLTIQGRNEHHPDVTWGDGYVVTAAGFVRGDSAAFSRLQGSAAPIPMQTWDANQDGVPDLLVRDAGHSNSGGWSGHGVDVLVGPVVDGIPAGAADVRNDDRGDGPLYWAFGADDLDGEGGPVLVVGTDWGPAREAWTWWWTAPAGAGW